MKILTGIAGMSVAVALMAAGCKTSESEKTTQALDYCITQLSKTVGTLNDSTRMPRSIAHGKRDWRFVGYRDRTSGFWPGNGGEIDASIIYADYYYLEALLRLKKILEGGLKK
ncbi:hypothetical protein A4D02_26740 [Niastella koreensis]|uniref:Uncharacterized protein n=2 Tax=Niastella koreensis TaxID=354356 RepID=G8TEL7_NIAKG|nr:hypothetical protein [Niastella koreensis]AEV99439.1 hypothetical protein Niako_3109 [Niastella koreensis GR20-10]OQP50038.1 hypothetical protein A4D02_26740 [Niastella koreensis]